MFREMRRQKQILTNEEIKEILKNERRGVLSLIGDDGYPYGIPMNHYYDDVTGKIFFHGGKRGHKVDAIKSCSKVSFCILGPEYQVEGDWAKYVKSVVVFGTIEIIDNPNEIVSICRKIGAKFPCPNEQLEKEIQRSTPGAYCFAITVEHMTGKLVHEA